MMILSLMFRNYACYKSIVESSKAQPGLEEWYLCMSASKKNAFMSRSLTYRRRNCFSIRGRISPHGSCMIGPNLMKERSLQGEGRQEIPDNYF